MKRYMSSSSKDYEVERLTEQYANVYLDNVEDVDYEQMVDYVVEMVSRDLEELYYYITPSRLQKQVAMIVDENWNYWV